MNSKEKGNIGQAVILSQFVKNGVQVSIPYGDNARYDLIADFNDKLNKIQIKYCDQVTKNGSVCLPCASSTNHTTNKKRTTYDKDVDYIACYIPKWQKTCLIPIQQVKKQKSIYLRQTLPINKQKKNIRLVSDYELQKSLCVETIHDEPKS